MKKLIFNRLLTVLFIAALFSSCSSTRQTQKWFKSGRWYNGMKLMPHSSIDRQELEKQYLKYPSGWQKAFDFLKETDLEKIAPGKYPLDGDSVYVNVTVGPMREFEKTKWEAHRHVIDLQYTCIGLEKMGVAKVQDARIITPYDEKKDVANYEAEGKYFVAGPGVFYLFFPGDAHRPNIKVNDDQNVKKIVVKIRYKD